MSADPFYYGDDDECACAMCETTRKMQALSGKQLVGIYPSIIRGPFFRLNDPNDEDVDVSNSGDLDDSYKDRD